MCRRIWKPDARPPTPRRPAHLQSGRDVATGEVTQSIDYAAPEALLVGLAWSPDGSTLYAAAGGSDKIRVYSQAGGRLGKDELQRCRQGTRAAAQPGDLGEHEGPRDPMPPPLDRSGGD